MSNHRKAVDQAASPRLTPAAFCDKRRPKAAALLRKIGSDRAADQRAVEGGGIRIFPNWIKKFDSTTCIFILRWKDAVTKTLRLPGCEKFDTIKPDLQRPFDAVQIAIYRIKIIKR